MMLTFSAVELAVGKYTVRLWLETPQPCFDGSEKAISTNGFCIQDRAGTKCTSEHWTERRNDYGQQFKFKVILESARRVYLRAS
jgi:hypothetical protein